MSEADYANRRQVLYWRLLARVFDPNEQPTLEAGSVAVVDDIGLPAALLDPGVSVDNIVQRFPELAAEFDGLLAPGEAGVEARPAGSVAAGLTSVGGFSADSC